MYNNSENSGFLSYVITILISTAVLFTGYIIASDGSEIFPGDSDDNLTRATVRSIVERQEFKREYDDLTVVESIDIIFTASIQQGRYSGRNITAVQTIDGFSYVEQKEVEPGDNVLIVLREIENNEYEWRFIEYIRSDRLLFLGMIFLVLLVIFGKIKGFNTILSLLFTCLAIFFVFIPSILSGKNIYVWTILTCIYVISTTLLIISGFNKKTLVAAAGCFAGVTATAIITLSMDRILHLTGFLDENSMHITNLPLENPINLNGIIFAAIVIGAMGAIMDVSVSIASSLWELKTRAKNLSFEKLYKSGINIGRDIMGTMSNTLILAYIGGALSLVILLSAYTSSLLELFNREMIVAEILKALTGSLGILLTIPLTAIASGAFYTRFFRKSR